jgi:hypothetical protein
MPKFLEGVVIFIGSITLYDKKSKKIGSLYPRRAKQLVLSGKAAWLDEGRSLQMASDITDSSSANFKEEKIVIDDNFFQTNEAHRASATASVPCEPDVLLMYQAKQNVKDKKNLIKHILAFIVAWPVLGIIYSNLVGGLNPRWWSVVENLGIIRGYIPEEHGWVLHHLENYFRWGYVPSTWYIFLGAVIAWGGWILFRIAKRVVRRIQKRSKLDPVLQEYNRLKGMVSDKAALY